METEVDMIWYICKFKSDFQNVLANYYPLYGTYYSPWGYGSNNIYGNGCDNFINVGLSNVDLVPNYFSQLLSFKRQLQ